MDTLNELLNLRQQLLNSRMNQEMNADAYNFLIRKCDQLYSMLSENEKLIYRDEVVAECGGTRNNGARIMGSWKRLST